MTPFPAHLERALQSVGMYGDIPALREAIERYRDEAVEECATKCDQWAAALEPPTNHQDLFERDTYKVVAKEIRALKHKEKP